MSKKNMILAAITILLLATIATVYRYSEPDQGGIYIDRWTGRTCTVFTDQCFKGK